MNYYNPYFYSMPAFQAQVPRAGLFSRLFGRSGITLSGILNGAQKALNFANQAIPLVKEIKPMIGNAKTMFKVMNEFKRVEKPRNNSKRNNSKTNTNNTVEDIKQNENIISENGPTFFV